MQNTIRRALVCLLAILSFFYLLAGFRQGYSAYDEGIFVCDAARVLNGDIPYRDFVTVYPPAQFFVLAGVFRLFGASVVVERAWSVFMLCLLSFTVYLAARKSLPFGLSLTAWWITVTWVDAFRVFASPVPSAVLFSLLSSFCLLNFLSRGQKAWLTLAGLSAGVATLFRHDLGLYTFVSGTLVLALYVLTNLTSRQMRPLERFWKAVRGGIPYALGGASVLFPAAAWLISVVPLADLWYDLVIYPVKVYPKVRALPFPRPLPNPVHLFTGALSPFSYAGQALNRAPFYFPVGMYVAAAVWLGVRIRNRRDDLRQIRVWSAILFLLLGLAFFNQARIRSDFAHLLPTFIPAVLLFATLLSEVPKTGRLRSALWVLAVLAGVSVLLNPVRGKACLIGESLFLTPAFVFDLPRARGITWDQRGTAYQDAIRYIQRNVPEGDKIFVGNARHDRIVGNDIMFYFLSGRHSATKYLELLPGLVTTPAIQKKIVEDIESQRVQYIALQDEERIEPNESGRSSGVRILDDFIRDRFTLLQTFENYTIWRRKEG